MKIFVKNIQSKFNFFETSTHPKLGNLEFILSVFYKKVTILIWNFSFSCQIQACSFTLISIIMSDFLHRMCTNEIFLKSATKMYILSALFNFASLSFRLILHIISILFYCSFFVVTLFFSIVWSKSTILYSITKMTSNEQRCEGERWRWDSGSTVLYNGA